MDRKQVMAVFNDAIVKFPAIHADNLRDYMETRLHIIELQERLQQAENTSVKDGIERVKNGPVLDGSDDAPNHLGSVIYNMLLESGPLRFNEIMKRLGKRHSLLRGVKYPQARVASALKRETAIERVAVGVYAANKDSVKR